MSLQPPVAMRAVALARRCLFNQSLWRCAKHTLTHPPTHTYTYPPYPRALATPRIMPSQALIVALRGFELFCALVVMALVGNMIASAVAGNPAVVNYDMFAAAVAMAALLYQLPAALVDRYSLALAHVVLDALNTLFWFCAAVATAAYLGVHSCASPAYTRSNHITNGAVDSAKRCREAQAATAFLWFGWAAFVASLVVSLLAGRGAVNMRPAVRRPAMSQV